MKTTQPSNVRTRAEILASIANLPDSVQGSISSYKITTSSGMTITYHKLQYWADGRNHAIHIPKERLPDFEAAQEFEKAHGFRISPARVRQVLPADAGGDGVPLRRRELDQVRA